MPRLVASDLDGTLLRPNGTLSPRTRSAIAAVRDAGLVMVLVTGRPPRAVRDIARQAQVGGLAICANGALVHDLDADATVTHTPLAAEVGRRLVEGLRTAAPGVIFGCEVEGTLHREPAYRSQFPDAGEVVWDDPADLVRGPVTKLLVRHPELPFEELVGLAAGLAGEDAVVAYAGTELVEISAAGATKAVALADLCGRLGVDAAEVVAFGDMPNDLPMLAWAGRSVAVANAHPKVLEEVDEVTASNAEDGVALVLERIVEELPARTAEGR